MRRAAAVVALLLAGCSDGTGSTPAPEPTAAVTTTLARTVTGAVDLRRLVVATAPAGYDLLPSPPYGAVDLQRLLAEFSDAPDDDKVILEGARFTRGHTRGWLRESPRSYLGVFVFEFADEDGARSARDGFAAQNVAKKGSAHFAVDTIADAVGESYTRQAEGEAPERVHLVTFVRGPRLYQVTGQSSDPSAPVVDTVAFAETEDALAA